MESWGSVLPDIVSGAAVAVIVAALALFVVGYFERRSAKQAARRERDLAAATALYEAHGDLFAAWKVWDFHIRRGNAARRLTDDRKSEIVQLAGSAEGRCESLLIRIALEHDLTAREKAALWSLRMAFKELRYAIRDDRQLAWWRSDTHGPSDGFREYRAFKVSMAAVAMILTEADSDIVRATDRRPPRDQPLQNRLENLSQITGNRSPVPIEINNGDTTTKKWVLVAEWVSSQAR
jgi:hypothetical protein